MPKKPANLPAKPGRPSDYSDDVVDRILMEIQKGRTLFEIGGDDDMPSFRTMVRWRRSKQEFCHLLEAIDEDQCRDARRSMREVVGLVHGALTEPFFGGITDEMRKTMKPAEIEKKLEDEQRRERARTFILDNVPAANFVTAGFERIAKVPVMKDVVVTDAADDLEDQRQKFDDLHPLTQDKIRQALLEDQRLRGEEEDE